MAQKTVSLNISVTAEEAVIDYCIQAYAEAYGWDNTNPLTVNQFTAKQIKQNIIQELILRGANKAKTVKETELVGFT